MSQLYTNDMKINSGEEYTATFQYSGSTSIYSGMNIQKPDGSVLYFNMVYPNYPTLPENIGDYVEGTMSISEIPPFGSIES